MHTTTELWIFGTALVAAIAAFAGAVGSRMSLLPDRVRRWHGPLLLLLAWYALWVGGFRSGLTRDIPRVSNLSQLVTGYSGPLLFLLTRALLDPAQRQRRWEPWLLLGGVPATLLCLWLLFSPDPQALIDAKDARLFSDYPVAAVLWGLHSAQIVVFVLGSIGIAAPAVLRATDPHDRARAVWALGPAAALLLAAMVSVLLPWTPVGAQFSGFGPVLSLPVTGVILGATRYAARERSRIASRYRELGRYLPQQIVTRIIDGRQRAELGGEVATATVLFTDLRGFTSLSEKLPPTEIVEFLNRYLGEMARVVFDHGGMLDKFIGDAVLAVFGVPDGGQDADAAVACALAMQHRFESVNRWWVARGHEPVAMGIGLARGPLVHGNIGSPERMEYTVIGDTVNTASRVEGLTKDYESALLLTASVAEAVTPGRFSLRPVAERQLRGRAEPIALYTVDGGET